MGHIFEWVIASGRLPLLCFFVAFIVTFVLTRVNVRLVRANVRWWFRDVRVGDVHVHHVVFGVVLMLIGGVSGFAIGNPEPAWYSVAAGIFGAGAALVLDEFALILHLRDVYWTERGRASVDAVFVAVAVTGLVLLGLRPLGFADLSVLGHPVRGPDALMSLAVFFAVLTNLLVDLALAAVTLLKGKIWTGLIGLFFFPLLIVGAIRVARPSSPWARRRYRRGSRKLNRAMRREERLRRPLIRAKIWLQEFVAGRHDLVAQERRRRNQV